MSNINRRLIGASAVLAPNNYEVTDVDLAGIVRRLLLFDKYVLVSVRLEEFPILAKHLGFAGLRDLLEANLIEIRHECLQLAQMGQAGMFGDAVLPPFTYKFNWIDATDKRGYAHDSLQKMHKVAGLSHNEVVKLKRAIANAIHPLPPDFRSQLIPAFQSELLQNVSLLRKAVELEIKNNYKLDGVPVNLKVFQEGEDTFKVETNLADHIGIDKAHKAIERAILAVAGLSQAIGEMKVYSAISGFRDDELPLFREKLDFMAETLSSHSRENSFQRVIKIAGLPQIKGGPFDVQKLLKLRDSSEAREFRDWLGGIGDATDSEIAERVVGLRARLGLKVSGSSGEAIRCLINTGLGFIPSAVPAALAFGVFDQFVIDKLLPRSGITAFVSELYPSLFERQQ